MSKLIELPKSVSELKGMIKIALEHQSGHVMTDSALNTPLAKALGFGNYGQLSPLIENQKEKPKLSLASKLDEKNKVPNFRASATSLRTYSMLFPEIEDKDEVNSYSLAISDDGSITIDGIEIKKPACYESIEIQLINSDLEIKKIKQKMSENVSSDGFYDHVLHHHLLADSEYLEYFNEDVVILESKIRSHTSGEYRIFSYIAKKPDPAMFSQYCKAILLENKKV